MKKLILIPVCLLLFSCLGEPGEEPEKKTPPKPATLDVEEPKIIKPDDNDSTLNEVDSLGRKIGRWETKVNGEVWKTEFFKNGKLDGLQTQKLNTGEILETNYRNGLKHGYSQQYINGAKVPKTITLYQNGKRVFSTFPGELMNGNFKKAVLSTSLDSLDIKLKYLNGKKFYTGKIKKQSSIKGVPVGEHIVYHENGKMKFLLDYEKDSIYKFDRKGMPIDTSYFSPEKRIWPKFDSVEIQKEDDF